jgi:hypothetical protein
LPSLFQPNPACAGSTISRIFVLPAGYFATAAGLTTPGIDYVLGSGGEPHPVVELEITAIHRMVEPGSSPMPWPYLEDGDRVVVQGGAFMGMEGFLL